MGRTHRALHLALQLLGVGPGDLVATSTLTFAASANAIRYVGAEPLFLDCDPQTWNMDPQLLALSLEAGVQRGARIKAVLAVDVCGQCADFEPIRQHCQYRLIGQRHFTAASYDSLCLPPRRGLTQQPRATPWVGEPISASEP